MSVGSWPWLFAVQVPFGALSWWLSLRYLPPIAAVRPQVRSGQRGAERVRSGHVHSGSGRDRPRPVAPPWCCWNWRSASCVGTIFVRRQLTLRAPMLPVDLFRRPVFALSVATASCVHGAAMIALITLPFYFQYVEGLSPIEIGLLITPWPAVLVVVGPIAGRLPIVTPPACWAAWAWR